MTEEQLGCWAEELAILLDGFGHLFARPEPREVFADVVQGLLSDAKRKNGWVRHEALCDRVEVRDLHRRAVAAAG
ncbi:hypothetical protein [Streptacidiphilus sp. PAMC 29251]